MDKEKEKDPTEDHRIPSSKRMLSTEDPDYTRPPDPKRIKELEERAQDELRERVINVVDRVLCNAINEKQTEMEEVDSRILRIQQCLHTLRYCVSLNYHAASKLTSSTSSNKQNYEVHPTVRKHIIGKAPLHTASHCKVSGSPFKDSSLPSTSMSSDAASRLSGESLNITTEMEKDKSLTSPSKFGNHKKAESGVSSIVGDQSKNLKCSRPPSPKYLPPKPPDTQTIAQGRHQRFQTKRRIVVGNTYQYLTPQAGREAEDAMRYKWQIYVRAPPQESDIASYVSDVTFILDRSYAPHHVINLTHPPFVLSRRGWGEFKVQIVLRFLDSRNKKVQLLHPLVLRRPDDPLALTGLWRLGRENWYDIWVYEGSSPEAVEDVSRRGTSRDDEVPAPLTEELQSGTVSARVDGNVTVSHEARDVKTSLADLQRGPEIFIKKEMMDDNETEMLFTNDERSENKCDSNSLIKVTVSDKTCATKNNSQNKVKSISVVSNTDKPVPQTSGNNAGTVTIKGQETITVTSGAKATNVTAPKVSVSNGAQSKMCKIHVRQPDGRLVPYFIPAHMYSVALKIAQMRSTSNNNKVNNKVDSAAISVNHQTGESSSSRTSFEDQTQSIERDTAGSSGIKKEVTNVTLPIKAALASSSKSPSSSSGTITEIKIPLKGKDGNLIKNQMIPVKILNVSSVQSPVKQGTAASGNCIRKLAFASQGALTQGALLQLLSKAGLKDKNTVVQKLLSKTGIREGAVDLASLQKIQGQLLTAQSSQGAKSNVHLMPIKIVQDKTKSKGNERQIITTASPSRIIQRPVTPLNIKFIASNSRLIPATSLGKGVMVNASARPPSAIIKPIRVEDAVGVKDRPSIFLTPDGKILTAGSTGLQVMTSQGRSVVSQANPLVISTSVDKGKVIQMPPLVVKGLTNSSGVFHAVTLPSTATTVSPSSSIAPLTVRPQIKSGVATNTTSITVSAAPLITNVKGTMTNKVPISKCIAVNATGLDKLSASSSSSMRTTDAVGEGEEEPDAQLVWEERVAELLSVSQACSSAEACVSAWVRALPLMSQSASEESEREMFPYRALSWEQFLEWPFGKQRAAEFQRGREVRRWLDKCKVEGLERWTVYRIVAWARRFAHTPLPYRRILRTDAIGSPLVRRCEVDTRSCVQNLEKLMVGTGGSSLLSPKKEPLEVDVVTLDEAENEKKRRKMPSTPLKNASRVLPLNDPDLVSGCEWVGRRTSELRVGFPPEELLPGYVVDVAKAVAWKAVLALMEDLLRSSYSRAWHEEPPSDVVVPPKAIGLSHLRDALVSSRPEFDLFTSDGLGTFAEMMENPL